MDETYDAIILGAGHNGLILQTYLAQAGLETLAVERRDEPGGGLAALEDPRHPGLIHNSHAFFLRAIDAMPWYRDLDLEGHGARMIEPALNVAMLTRDGGALEWWTDIERTVASFAQVSERDARTLRRWFDEFGPVVERILIPEATSPPIPLAERRALLERSAEGRRLLEVSALSPLEFVRREFESPVIQAGLLFFNGLREVDLRIRGFGHHIAFLLANPSKAQMSAGGSAALGRALARAAETAGGRIATGAAATRILIENGLAEGVETADGKRYRARHLIASSLNPQQTFLDLIDPDALLGAWRKRAAGFRYNILAPLFALNLALDAPPAYAAAARYPELAQPFMTVLGLDHVDRFDEIVRHHEAGSIPPTVMWGTCPTQFDPGQSADGKHAAFMWEKLPYALGGDPANWDAAKDDHGETMLDLWSEYAPGLRKTVIGKFTRSPLDIERDFPNMAAGDLLVGAFTDGQIGYHRPFEGAGDYRTCIRGLYLCGSSSHPGGNITGLPGYNAAQTIFHDLGLHGDWLPLPAAQRIAELAA
ncbi:MAG: NAD(P)/FAD-dependent oxidoreductase [Rhodospirillaceae bacterium]|nr:NAD(P)/FAD-dependent oxidoreductase [Rhodospirillaceae bacterium]